MITGYGPHVWAWGVQYALAKMGLPTLPGGGMDARARANIVIRYQPTILLCTPSYALHLGRTMEALGVEPRTTAVRTLFVAGEPGMSVAATRERMQQLWGARLVEFYGCTEPRPMSAASRVRTRNRRTDWCRRICSRTCRFGRRSIRNRSSRRPTARAG
jgi:phenylacetate-CoA ligase